MGAARDRWGQLSGIGSLLHSGEDDSLMIGGAIVLGVFGSVNVDLRPVGSRPGEMSHIHVHAALLLRWPCERYTPVRPMCEAYSRAPLSG